MIKYEGIFFENDACNQIHSLETNKLPIVNDVIHCTFKYRPINDEIFNDIIGKEFELYITSYGNDGQNSGFEVMLPKQLEKYYINYDSKNPKVLVPPHITASLSEDAEAKNTKNLKFEQLKEPIKVNGKFGYWIEEETREYLSFDPFYKTNIQKK